MASNVKPTAFVTSPDDKWATVDVYAETEVVKPKEGAVTRLLGETKSLISDTVGKASDISLKDLAKAAYKKDTKTEKSILAQMKDVTKGAVAGVNDLKSDLSQTLMTSAGINPDKAKTLTDMLMKGKNIKQGAINALLDANPRVGILYNAGMAISGADLHSAKGIIGIVNSISGNSKLAEVLDMEGSFKVLGKLATYAAKIQMGVDLYDKILDKFHDWKHKKKFLLSISREAFLAGDLVLIDKIVTANGSAAVLAKVPDAVSLILMGVQLPYGHPVPTMDLRNLLVSVLNKVDPHWDRYKRNGVWISNLEPFTYMGPGAKALLGLTRDYLIPMTIADSYPIRNLKQLGKQVLPFAAY